MSGLSDQFIYTSSITGGQWLSLTGDQLSYLSPHAASFISVDKLMTNKTMTKMREIRAAVGEDPVVVEDMEKMMNDMENDDSAAVTGQPSLLIMIVLVMIKIIM